MSIWSRLTASPASVPSLARRADDPKSSLIWEAFKADTEPKRSTQLDEFEARRDALLAQIRRGPQVKAVQTQKKAEVAEPKDFVEDQGGVY